MRAADYIKRGRAAFEAIRNGAKTAREVGEALRKSGVCRTTESSAQTMAQHIVNTMIARGRIVRVDGELRVKTEVEGL